MMSSSSGTSVMMSPSHMHREGKSCVQFSFFAEKREANSSSGLSVQLWEESVQNTKKVMWNRNQSSDGYWQNGQFQLDLPAGNFRLVFLADIQEDGFMAVDNVTIQDGDCPKLGWFPVSVRVFFLSPTCIKCRSSMIAKFASVLLFICLLFCCLPVILKLLLIEIKYFISFIQPVLLDFLVVQTNAF